MIRGALLKKTEHRDATHPRTVLRHLDSSFGVYFQMVGAAYEDHKRLESQLPAERLLDSRLLWTPHIAGKARAPRNPKPEPVVGFHSFGNQYRWPAKKEIFEDIYLTSGYSVLFYGLLKPARDKLGDEIISESQKLDHNKYLLTDFLDRIDFWVYYPNDRLIDRPWTAALQAMQAGKVVILPQHLKPIYKDGAIYAAPKDVARVIREYSQDETKYRQQAQRAQDVVAKSFSLGTYASRLYKLLDDPR